MEQINPISEEVSIFLENQIKLSDDFLKDSVENAFNILLISKKKSHKIKISKAYLMGYLQIAQ